MKQHRQDDPNYTAQGLTPKEYYEMMENFKPAVRHHPIKHTHTHSPKVWPE